MGLVNWRNRVKRTVNYKRSLIVLLISSLILLSQSACSQNYSTSRENNVSPNTYQTTANEAPTEADGSTSPSEDPASNAAEPTAVQDDSKTLDDTSLSEQQVFSSSAALAAFESVLLNKSGFYEIGKKTSTTLSGLIDQADKVGASDGLMWKIDKFAILDMDGDGIPELVVTVSIAGKDYNEYSLIMHYQDGVVNCYTLPFRSFNSLRADGTFAFASSAWDCGFASINFSAGDDSSAWDLIDRITYCETDYDKDGRSYATCYVDREVAPEEAFTAATEEWTKRPEATWYDYSDAGISGAFAQG